MSTVVSQSLIYCSIPAGIVLVLGLLLNGKREEVVDHRWQVVEVGRNFQKCFSEAKDIMRGDNH